MERHWHDSQTFFPQDDGGVIMELQVGNLWEVRRWLIGWGADAELLSPSDLREEMKRSAQETFAQYTGREVSA
jgi:proteasome accessory factor B